MMKLYQFENCPYCEKTRLGLEEKGIAYQKIEVPYHKREEVLCLSGQKLVPVIADGEVIVADSPLIADYLEEKYPEPALYPGGRAMHKLIEEWADFELARDPLLLAFPEWYHSLKDPAEAAFFKEDKEKRNAPFAVLRERAPKYLRRFRSHLAYLEEILSQRDCLLGAFGQADISVYAQLWTYRRLCGEDVFRDFLAVSRWQERVESRHERRREPLAA